MTTGEMIRQLNDLDRRVERLETQDSFVSTAAAVSGAPADAAYVVLAYNGNLSQERLLQATPLLTITDGGANLPVTVAIGNYARGSVIRAGAAAWEALVHPGADYVLGTDATDTLWKLATTSVPLPPVAEGDILIANNVPAWSIRTLGAQFTHLEAGAATATWVTDITMQDGAWVGTAANDVRCEYDSSGGFLKLGLGDAAGADQVQVLDSGNAVVAYVDSDGNADFNSHMAVGSSATVSTTSVFKLQEASTALAGANEIGIDANLNANPAGAATSRWHAFRAFCTQLSAQPLAGGQALRGFFGGVQISGTGTVAGAIALHAATNVTVAGAAITTLTNIENIAFIGVGDSATVTNKHALKINDVSGPGTWTITNNYGIRVLNISTGTNVWAIQTNAGNVVLNEGGDANTNFRVESNNFTHMHFVDAGFDSVLINSSADLSSTFGVVTTALGDIGIVVRGSASQAANLQEWQSVAPATLLSVDASGNLVVIDDNWIGLSAFAGRLLFNSTPAPDQIQVANADLDFITANHGIIHVGGVAAGMVLVADGTRYVPAAAATTLPIAPVAEGDMLAANAVPAWSILSTAGVAGYALVSTATTQVWDQTPTWTGDGHTWVSATSLKPVLTIENTNADGASPIIHFYKNSASPADGDNIGAVEFFGRTSTGAIDVYAFMLAESLDVTNADFAGGLKFTVLMDAVERNLLEIAGYNGSVNEGEVIINQDGQDVDFRVEAVGAVNALFVQGSDGNVGANMAAPAAQLHVDQSNAAGAKPCLILDQGDASEQCIQFSGDGADQDIFLFTVNVTGTPTLMWDESEDALIISGADLHMNSGIVDTVKIRRSGDVTNTEADIYCNDVGGFAADDDIFMFIDADNDTANAVFVIAKDAETTVGATEIFRIDEAANALLQENAVAGPALYLQNTHAVSKNALIRINDTGGNRRFALDTDSAGGGGNDVNFYDSSGAIMVFDGSGNVGIGAAAGPTANGGQVLFFGDNAADPTMAANTAGFYGKDVAGTVEAFAIDEAGNAQQLTSHNFTLFDPDPSYSYPWSFYARNEFLGKEIGVDMYGAIKAIEALTAGQFIFERDIPKRAWPTGKAPPVWMLERMRS